MGKRALVIGVLSAAVLSLVGCGGESRAVTETHLADPRASLESLDGAVAPATLESAVAIARRDQSLTSAIGDVGYTIVDSGYWRRPGLKGLALDLELRRPVRVAADLPHADTPEEGPSSGICREPYRQTWRHEESRNVTRVRLLIDLAKRRVANITTNAKVWVTSPVPGKAADSCQPNQR